ncbi:hypothetical protein MSI_23150 [Treponema sp. JC4]|uniref:hypothetical protein n=1 Tax=Treponema sp. JC4 TaxID=1124982 RepID=UPI00025B079D|nr:hypothetical protein [Treponema sp. JC4]EID84228.1 hypothetical protein MSI_23150 [Treponema sp. JC4]
MKKLVAGALALALGFSAFAQEAHELVGSAGKISFGAWGRSTWNIGNQYTSTKIEVTPKLSTKAYYNYIANDITTDPTGQLYAVADAATGGNLATILAGVATGDTASLIAFDNVVSGMATTSAVTSGIDSGVVSKAGVAEADESDTEWYASVAPDWSYGCRVGFWIIGRTNDERWGFDFNLDSDAAALFVGAQNYDSNSTIGSLKTKNNGLSYAESGKYAVAIGDQAKIWGIFDFNPIDLKVAFGKMREQELRGSIGDFGQRESSDVKSEDDIFTEMWPVMGLFVSAKGQEGTALEGLYAAVDCDAFGLVSDGNGFTTNLGTLASTIQGGVGYTIPGLAQVKAQFIADSIEEGNKKYSAAKYAAAREKGFGWDDYAGRFEFGIDWLGFAGGATGLGNVDLDATPNANLIELGVKVPLVLDEDLRQYDPEKFYNFYACLGTIGVIQKGFILYKAHVWGGKGESNLTQYTDIGTGSGLLDYTGNAANIVRAGFDALAEVCLNPFGKQNNFAGLSFNYNITLANADGTCKVGGNPMTVNDLKMTQHNFGIEVYLKHTFAANNYFFIGVADRLTVAKMEGSVNLKDTFLADAAIDLSYTGLTNKVYIPVGVEMFF